MKLRIKGNSIRLRLTKSELSYFEKFKIIEEKTEFGNSVFQYALKVYEGDELSADFSNETICLNMPASMAEEWVKTERVGFGGEMDLANGKKLYLILEKDFKCLD